jgi:hypothetical protein
MNNTKQFLQAIQMNTSPQSRRVKCEHASARSINDCRISAAQFIFMVGMQTRQGSPPQYSTSNHVHVWLSVGSGQQERMGALHTMSPYYGSLELLGPGFALDHAAPVPWEHRLLRRPGTWRCEQDKVRPRNARPTDPSTLQTTEVGRT